MIWDGDGAMAILRMYDDLSPDLTSALARETGGETVKWAGRSSGVIEKLQGWALVGGGAIFALANLGGPTAALGVVVDLLERGQAPGGGAIAAAGLHALLFVAGVALAIFGWLFVKSAAPVVWAVTNRRFLRIVAGGAQPTRAWLKPDILNIDEMNWSDPQTRCLSLRVRGGGHNDPVLMIIGPADLEAAERALDELEA